MILFLIRSLDYGGAERQMVALAKGLKDSGLLVKVAVFYNQEGTLTETLSKNQIEVLCLDKKGRWDILFFLKRLILLLGREKPQIVHSYLGTPNIIIALLKPMFPNLRIAWGIRAADVDLSLYDWLSRLSYWFESHLSFLADLIIANSFAGKSRAVAKGFAPQKIKVIFNGIDTSYFRPDNECGRKIRHEWGVRDAEILVGMVGRLDPIKDHQTFLKAASLSSQKRSNLRFVCVGEGPQNYKSELLSLSQALNLEDKVIWAGPRTDMPAVYNALNLVSCCSQGEGFSNVIAEAMACGIGCVVTNVGDSASIVGNTGIVVPAKDHRALSTGILEMLARLDRHRDRMRTQVRNRIVDNFDLESMITNTKLALDSLDSI